MKSEPVTAEENPPPIKRKKKSAGERFYPKKAAGDPGYLKSRGMEENGGYEK